MKIRTSIVIAAFCVFIGFIFGFYFRLPKKEEPPVIEYVDSGALNRLKIEEALVKGLEQEQKLIVLDVLLSEDIYIDDSFNDWDILKKIQKVTINANGKFTTDLAALSADDILFDNTRKEVTLKLLRPEIDSVTINEEQVVFHSVERGLLRFGEIKLTMAEQNEIYKKAKENMVQKLNLDTMAEACEYTKSSVISLANKFLIAANIDDYNVDVVWK